MAKVSKIVHVGVTSFSLRHPIDAYDFRTLIRHVLLNCHALEVQDFGVSCLVYITCLVGFVVAIEHTFECTFELSCC